jgi:hypothetical protein
MTGGSIGGMSRDDDAAAERYSELLAGAWIFALVVVGLRRRRMMLAQSPLQLAPHHATV